MKSNQLDISIQILEEYITNCTVFPILDTIVKIMRNPVIIDKDNKNSNSNQAKIINNDNINISNDIQKVLIGNTKLQDDNSIRNYRSTFSNDHTFSLELLELDAFAIILLKNNDICNEARRNLLFLSNL